jgi:hypothetical protein
MDSIMDSCSSCGALRVIQNKKHWLCGECVFKKNHGGKSREEVYRERHEKKEKKKGQQNAHLNKKGGKDKGNDIIGALKRRFSIKKISDKRAKRHAERDKVYARIDMERDRVCEGCSRGDISLSHSHILSEQDRPDLYANEDNIRLHCFGGYGSCHETWERGIPDEVVRMHDFKENLAFIKEVDIKRYNAIVAKFEFDGVKLPDV